MPITLHNVHYRRTSGTGCFGSAALGRTGGNNIPKAASLVQSGTGLAVIAGYALAHADPMTSLFFDLGTTGGFGILVLLAVTSVAVIAFFARDWHGENA